LMAGLSAERQDNGALAAGPLIVWYAGMAAAGTGKGRRMALGSGP
jgi:hypothetical protein